MRRSIHSLGLVTSVFFAGAVAIAVFADDPAPRPSVEAEAGRTTTQVAALRGFQKLIGDWRGIGQPKRGSSSGSWQETATAAWRHKGTAGHPETGISWRVAEGKLWKSALLSSVEKDRFRLDVTLPDDGKRTYSGKLDGDKLMLVTAELPGQDVSRITLTWLNDNRLVALFEKRAASQTFFQRVAEVGYQREGTRLATADTNGPECVVTGGLGTIPVTYEGKTYYVCCTGCRDAFNDDPKAILAEWAERRAKANK